MERLPLWARMMEREEKEEQYQKMRRGFQLWERVEEAEKREEERMARMTEQTAAYARWVEMRQKEKEKEKEGDEKQRLVVLPIDEQAFRLDWDGPRLLAMTE